MAEAEELEAVERERARRRKAEAGKANLPTVSAGNVSTTHEDKGRTRDKVAAAVGLGSGRTYLVSSVLPLVFRAANHHPLILLTRINAAAAQLAFLPSWPSLGFV